MKLYIFRTVPLSIIRSLLTVNSAMEYVTQVCRELSSRTRMELSLTYIQTNKQTETKLTTNFTFLWPCIVTISL